MTERLTSRTRTPRRSEATVECRSNSCPTVLAACDDCDGTGTIRVKPPDRCRCGGYFTTTGERTPAGVWARVCNGCERTAAGREAKRCDSCEGDGQVVDVAAHRVTWTVTIEQDTATFIVAGNERCPTCGSDNIEVVAVGDDA